MSTNLHDAFRDPARGVADALARFLEDVDRLPGIRAIHAAMRRALDIRPGMRVLDAGCGVGLETSRLAADHPEAEVTGLDRNAELLRAARLRPEGDRANLQWHEADLADLDLPPVQFDAIRTERVLMYLPDPAFERVVDRLVSLLRPGGTLVLFELDYGATILPPAGHDDDVVRRAETTLERLLPQAWAGRRLPELLADRGVAELDATPYSFAVNESIWRRIVGDTLRADTDAGALSAWLGALPRRGFLGAFTGVLTVATVG
jgi:ubiquinone/menaquinone biosynthesis C-methylase UbiE